MMDMLVVLMMPVGGLKAPTAILENTTSSKTQHQNQTNLTNTRRGCIDTQPVWGHPCSWVTFELWAGHREHAAKPREGAILTIKL